MIALEQTGFVIFYDVLGNEQCRRKAVVQEVWDTCFFVKYDVPTQATGFYFHNDSCNGRHLEYSGTQTAFVFDN